jgi:proteasome lid subunit RPN8/RPN11
VIRLDADAISAISRHARRTYPEECCGALLGKTDSGAVRVMRIERIENSSREQRRRRYVVAPLEYARVERAADAAGLSVLGFYHSHPDHPAVPSEYDREHGFPFFHYVILAVGPESSGEIASYVLSEDRGVFEREELVVSAQAGE